MFFYNIKFSAFYQQMKVFLCVDFNEITYNLAVLQFTILQIFLYAIISLNSVFLGYCFRPLRNIMKFIKKDLITHLENLFALKIRN